MVWYDIVAIQKNQKRWCHQFGRIYPNRKFVTPLGLEKSVTKSMRNGSVGGAQRAKETSCDADFCEVFFRMPGWIKTQFSVVLFQEKQNQNRPDLGSS